MGDALEGFNKEQFTAEGKTRDVYRTGTGPAVIVISEMPGITPEVLGFARSVAAIGCTSVLPHLFGTPGKSISVGYTLQSIAPACVSREFSCWATGRTSPVTTWLRHLASHEHERCGGPGVGAIGMCFTGGFALAMMVDDVVKAPVLSQPSMPFSVSKRHRADVGLSESDFARVQQRCRDEEDLCVLGVRFTGDRMAPHDRFATLKEHLGDKFVGIEIDSSPGNPWGYKKMAHSVVTNDLKMDEGSPTREAFDKVLELFRTRLVEPAAAT